jgi:hypothetical protein
MIVTFIVCCTDSDVCCTDSVVSLEENNNSLDELIDILHEQGMTYVLNRLNNCRNAYSAGLYFLYSCVAPYLYLLSYKQPSSSIKNDLFAAMIATFIVCCSDSVVCCSIIDSTVDDGIIAVPEDK